MPSLPDLDHPVAHELLALGAPDTRRAIASGSGPMAECRSSPSSDRNARGVLFGVGHLLRELRMSRGDCNSSSPVRRSRYRHHPEYPLRGHQLGYRHKTNSYDGWDLPQWEQYIRDLAVFGTNAIELIPPRSDDCRTASTSRGPSWR